MKYQISNIKYQKEDSGLTLIEVLVAMGIATVAGVLLLVIIVSSAGLFSKQSAKVEEGIHINDALQEVRGALKRASGVAASYTTGPVTYTSGAETLVLKVSSLDSSNNIISDTYDYFVFFKDQNYLRLRTFPDPLSSAKPSDRVFSNTVDSLNFQYFNSAVPPVEVPPAQAVKVRITLSLKQDIATSEASLRND